MNNDIKNIYNTLAVMYSDFLKDRDIKRYTKRAAELAESYSNNKMMLSFCENLIITWTPIINHIKYVSGECKE